MTACVIPARDDCFAESLIPIKNMMAIWLIVQIYNLIISLKNYKFSTFSVQYQPLSLLSLNTVISELTRSFVVWIWSTSNWYLWVLELVLKTLINNNNNNNTVQSTSQAYIFIFYRSYSYLEPFKTLIPASIW